MLPRLRTRFDRIELQRTALLSALARHDPAHPSVRSLEALQLVAAVHLHPMLLDHVLEEAPDLVAELALQRDLLLHHDLPTLSGPTDFSPEGTMNRHVFLIQVKQGKLVQIEPTP